MTLARSNSDYYLTNVVSRKHIQYRMTSHTIGIKNIKMNDKCDGKQHSKVNTYTYHNTVARMKKMVRT